MSRDSQFWGLYEYPFPLTDGRLGYLHLPPDLTEHDAGRLCEFIRALPIPAGTQPEAGDADG